jgi:cytochrome c oxidase cbb3-type subunit 2
MPKGHSVLEKNIGLMGVAIAIVVSIGGLVQIVPLMFQASVVEPLPGQKPYPALELAGRDVYLREGCYGCHSQMIRTLRFETARYGHYSLAAESVYDHPFQWGSKRTGPDLARVGGRYSDEWHRVHLINPRDVVPQSNMPGYPWLQDRAIDGRKLAAHMKALQRIGVPYTDDDIAAAPAAVEGKAEMDATIAYLQGLGRYGPKMAAPDVASAPPAAPEPAIAQADAGSSAGEAGGDGGGLSP